MTLSLLSLCHAAMLSMALGSNANSEISDASSTSPVIEAISASFIRRVLSASAQAIADDNVETSDNISGSSQSSSPAVSLGVSITFLLFGWIASVLASVLAYWSIREDILLRRYLYKGKEIYADVISNSFARRGIREDQNEYITIVEYDQVLTNDTASGYAVRIRKQLRTIGDAPVVLLDLQTVPSKIFWEGNAKDQKISSSSSSKSWVSNTSTSNAPEQNTVPLHLATIVEKQVTDSALLALGSCNPADECNPSDPARMQKNESVASLAKKNNVGEGITRWHMKQHVRQKDNQDVVAGKLKLLILPSHPRSGYPKSDIERKCGISYLIPTAALVTSIFSITVCCFVLGGNTIHGIDGNDDVKRVAWIILGCFVTASILQLPLLHFCCHDIFVKSIEAEYLENADMVSPNLPRGDSSLTSLKTASFDF